MRRPFSLFKALRSVKLAIALVALLAAGAGAAGLIPQGLSPDAYRKAYPALSGPILAIGLDHYFSSLLFIATAGLFILNLGSCTAFRLVSELTKKGGRRRFGPDLLHAGFLVLALGAILSASGRTEARLSLSRGDEVLLPGGELLKLLDVEARTYPDGSPSFYRSTVELREGKGTRRAEISVNRPLKVGRVSVYQASYGRAASAILEAPMDSLAATDRSNSVTTGSKAALRIYGGETKELGGGKSLFFMALEGLGPDARGLFLLTERGERRSLSVGPDELVAGYKLASFEEGEVSGLKVASDPGYPFVLAGFALLALGLCLTYIQKIQDVHP